MRPLFFRILAVLLASFVGVLLVAFFLFRWGGSDFESEHEPLQALALVTSSQLVDAHIKGNPGSVMRKLRKHFRARAWVLDSENRAVFGAEVPPRILSLVTTYPAFIPSPSSDKGRRFIFANQVMRQDKTYNVIIESPGPGFRHGPMSIPFNARFLLLLLSLALASALLSYWVLRPVKAFTKTTKQLSGEHLDARIPPSITKRRDAFGDLGREFNQMTDRLTLSLDSQRQLLRDVSHELRSPLARIQVAASLLHQKLGDRTEISRIENEVERLDDLIERLLSLSRLQNARGMELGKIDIRSLLSELIADANYEFTQQHKQASLLPGAEFVLLADNELLSSALENIIRNGLRFTAKGEPVTVSCIAQRRGNVNGARITVSDRGPGIDPLHLPHMFEPFYQADSSRQSSNGHHGIGLALARAILVLHNGTIEAFNREDGGLSVLLWLPLDPDKL